MRIFRRLPRRMRFALAMVGVNLVVFSAFRVAFWWIFHSTAGPAAGALAEAWYLGFKFDLRLALLICLPLLLLSWIPPLNPVRSRAARGLWLGFYSVLGFLFFLIYSVDLGHYGYLSSRIDAGLVEHLLPLDISARMTWETYPVVWALLGLAVLVAGYALLIRRAALRELELEGAPLAPWPRSVVVTAFVLLYAFGIYGKWSWYPLRWSDAFFTNEPFCSALALNPILFLADTFPNRDTAYDEAKVRQHYERIARLLEVDEPNAETLNFSRYVEPTSRLPGRPNLVVIHLEAFAGYKTGVLGNTLRPTPEFDAIAGESILFTNFFVPTVPTARSVFTMFTGIPDVNPVRSASRNPRIVSQHTLINELEGYARYYFLGGSATWGNIRAALAHNLPGLLIYEEGDYDAPRDNVWGVSDLALLEKAHEVLRMEARPFFAFIQTAGNHRPYTIPEDRRDFVPAEVDEPTLLLNGFLSLEAFNGMRFLDFSLGHFFRLAREEPYFRNTIFVMYGDHGSNTTEAFPWERIELTRHHVPMVIYAPGFVSEGRRVDTVASLVDLLPTALSLIGTPYLNTTMGRDLLVPRSEDQHLIYVLEGVLTDEDLLRVDPRGASHLYRYRSSTATVDLRDQLPDETARLRERYEGLYETARYLLYHNPPRQAGDGSVASR